MTLRTLAIVVLVGAACSAGIIFAILSRGGENAAPSHRPRSEVQVRAYTVRGVIEAMPSPDKPGAQFIIRHEDIPDFVASDGSRGMKSMAMPFPLAAGVSLDGLRVGDQVEFDFTVDWNSDLAYWITRIARAPAGPTR